MDRNPRPSLYSLTTTDSSPYTQHQINHLLLYHLASLATMLFLVLAFLINLFFVYVAIACMFWSFVVLLRFWCALLEVPLHAEVAFELWDRVLILGLGLYFWVLLETFLLWVSSVISQSSLTVPDIDGCRSNRLREDA